MKLDIIGNIKIDERNPEKIKQAVACIRSYNFLKQKCTFWLNTEGGSSDLYKLLKDSLHGHQFQLTNYSQPNFGAIYCEMLNDSKADYIINFESDHFMLCDSLNELIKLIEVAKTNNTDVIRSSFHEHESKCSTGPIHIVDNKEGRIFSMDIENFKRFNHFCTRYFLGTNGIFKREFALRFWGRKFQSYKPHEWEIMHYSEEYQYICMVPGFEIQASIEDDHGEPNTCLLKRKDEKFWDIYNSIQLK